MEIIEHNESIMKVHRENATWLGVIDIAKVAPVTLTVKRVFRFTGGVFEGGRKEDGQAISFEETTKFLKLNATNTGELYKHGEKPADFVGAKITLDAHKLKREFQGKTHGVRIVRVAK